MDLKFNKYASLCLFLGSAMLVITMVFHPTGGNAKEILQIYNLAVGTHSLAILSLPILSFGFLGLTKALSCKSQLAVFGFIVICFSLTAGMIAGAMNGLVLPFFVKSNINDFAQNEQVLKYVINYGLKINLAMDYILIDGLLLAFAIFSFVIIKHFKNILWIGYLGLSLLPIAVTAAMFKFNFTSVSGFRIFIFAIVFWIFSMAQALYYSKFN